MGRRGLAAVVVCVCCLLAACTSSSEVPSPTPAGPAIGAAHRAAEAANFSLAETAYRTFTVEWNRLLLAGGAADATAVMKTHAGGPFLTEKADYLAQQKRQGITAKAEAKIAYVKPQSSPHRDGGPVEVTLAVCEDFSSVDLRYPDGKRVASNNSVRRDLQLRSVDGHWKVWDGNRVPVSSCPG